MKDKTYLFVYGTLRKGFGLRLMQEMDGGLIYIGGGKAKAALYDLGTYPGAVKSKDDGELQGDVFEVLNATNAFQILDEYEGDEYKREKATITTETKEKTEAWIYWYTGSIDGKFCIPNGDYLEHLKTKKTV